MQARRETCIRADLGKDDENDPVEEYLKGIRLTQSLLNWKDVARRFEGSDQSAGQRSELDGGNRLEEAT